MLSIWFPALPESVARTVREPTAGGAGHVVPGRTHGGLLFGAAMDRRPVAFEADAVNAVTKSLFVRVQSTAITGLELT